MNGPHIISLCFALVLLFQQATMLVAKTDEIDQKTKPSVKLGLTINWSNPTLANIHMQRLDRFEESFPEAKIIHFVSPTFLLSGSGREIIEYLRLKQNKGHLVGLYADNQDEFLKFIHVVPKSRPNFWHNQETVGDCIEQCGTNVPINAYSHGEILQIIGASKELLVQSDLLSFPGVRVAGWMNSALVRRAIVQFDFEYDFSSVAPEILASKLSHYPIFTWVKNIWHGLKVFDQPFLLDERFKNEELAGYTRQGQKGVFSFPDNFIVARDLPQFSKTYSNVLERLKNEAALHQGLYLGLSFEDDNLYWQLPHLGSLLKDLHQGYQIQYLGFELSEKNSDIKDRPVHFKSFSQEARFWVQEPLFEEYLSH